MARIVLIAGFESFNIDLYRKATERATARCPRLEISVFSDRDIATNPNAVAEALVGADVFFASLIFDYDQVMWLRDRPPFSPAKLKLASQTSNHHDPGCHAETHIAKALKYTQVWCLS